jgi:hypothetical protein
MTECLQCGWIWIPRKKHPKTCPKCKSLNWKKPKTRLSEKYPSIFNPLTPPSKDFIQIGDIEKQRRDNPAILQ